ncbi:MAG TPA: VWA domain-containing protein [Terriglobales bacterium]
MKPLRLPAVALLLALELLAPFAVRAEDPQKDTQEPAISVDVKLVNVFVTVTDASGAPARTLTRDSFALFEDGVPQAISVFNRESELPLSIVMAVDASLSTKKDLKLELVSARKFAHEIMRPQDALALYQFSEIVEELVPFTSDLKRIDAGIERVHVRSATAMYDAIYLGSEALYKRPGRKVMVIITDGGDTMSSTSYQEALRAAQQSEATVYSMIVVPIEASAGRELGGEHALIQLSHDTGGKYYYADTLPRLEQAFQQISEELRAQYLLAYYPVRRIAETDFRKIKVELKGPATGGLRARHRTGYFTSKFK